MSEEITLTMSVPRPGRANRCAALFVSTHVTGSKTKIGVAVWAPGYPHLS
jgi:hypothetical protein